MSTKYALTLIVVALSGVGGVFTPNPVQSGTGPNKIIGPTAVSTSTTRLAATAKQDVGYTYTVQLTNVSAFDQQVDVYDSSGSLLPCSPVTVPAGQLTQDFTVYAMTPGDDTLTAANGYSSASMDVTVY